MKMVRRRGHVIASYVEAMTLLSSRLQQKASSLRTGPSGASYLGAWGLTATHLILWILITVSILTSEAVTIGYAVLSIVATCLFIWMVISIHHRFQIQHGGRTHHVVSVGWRGPWDPVGRQIWLPVRFGAAWRVVRHGPEPKSR